MKVHIVVESDWDSSCILGVYLVKADAEQHMALVHQVSPDKWGHLTEVEEKDVLTAFDATTADRGVNAAIEAACSK